MREILFKAKRKDNNTWTKGYYVRLYNTQNKEISHRIYTGYSECCGDELFEEFYEVMPETICEFIGLTDKNGVKIFENDVVDIHQTVNGYNQFVIEYDDYKFSARYYNQKTKEIGSLYGYSLDELFEINEYEKEIEVIGNKFDEGDNNANTTN